MCTENYIKSKTPITDLSNYCLSKNTNIPTQTYSTTTPTDPIVLTSTLPKLVLPNITLPTISSNKQQYASSASALPAHVSSSNYYYDINKPTKLDLLIQTATMNQSQAESFKPNNNDFSCLINTSSGPSSTTSSLNNDSSTSSTSSVDGSSSPSNINISNSISIQSTEPTVENNSNFYVYSPENTKKRKMILNGSLSMEKSNSLSDIIKKTPIIIASDNKKSPLKKQKKSNDSSAITTTDSIKVASPSLTSKRQRSGPSCDCCRSRKIKCDSEITILSTVSNLNASTATTQESLIKESQIAHCSFLFKDDSNYQYFQINSNSASPQPSSPPSSVSTSASASFSANKLNSFKFLKFKSCSACKLKSLNCCFSKGFTRNDIIKFNKSEKLHSDSSQNHNESSVTPTLVNNELALDSDTNTSRIKSTTESLKNSNYLSVINLSSPAPSFPPPTSSLLPSSMGYLEQQEQQKDIDPTSSSNSNNTSKNSKKTSCKSCRFKKIKCIKIEASTNPATGNGDDSLNSTAVCLNCSKKNLNCIYN